MESTGFMVEIEVYRTLAVKKRGELSGVYNLSLQLTKKVESGLSILN